MTTDTQTPADLEADLPQGPETLGADLPQATDSSDDTPDLRADLPEGSEPETFPRQYVEQLRDEAAKYRQRAGRADEATRRLLEATVAGTARDHLADPSDLLTFVSEGDLTDDDGWPDIQKITAAAETLAASKPHLAPRRPRGDIGQGATQSGDTVNLAAMMRARAS